MSWVEGQGLNLMPFAFTFPSFGAWDEMIALVNAGQPTETAVDATFSYDDTLFGATPDGCYKRVVSHAVNPPGRFYSAEFCTLPFSPLLAMGFDLPDFIPGSTPTGGTITDLHVSMDGFGELDCAEIPLSNAAGSAQLVRDNLPWLVNDTNQPPQCYLLRPLPLAYPGLDPANDANRILWRPTEIGIVRWTFSVHTTSLRVSPTFFPRAYSVTP